ncbi:hypothetical protein COU20_01490 [Candidatus Kaiserbacteria bacterium CG10_big_fil_rev_8_21_14_0_10_59_10]|uniref:Uncharacterized protein n=1 Tax=Candidatus Kaiserbacteria bacterium CG10_big_fil_rev_8_21_14_0_10_59_10 TaxID=1974612 RepID=A0A2H0UA93_9BACT|nr:MAG: hypothetical protein COU20_01490 [Candidatus Kaiserbacteria bacterium CG10_big_fil_rev_8_21_14_0_10_59_10]
MNKIILALLAAIVLVGVGMYIFSSAPETAQNGLGEPGEPEARVISWEEAVERIKKCDVDMVFQTHALDVHLYLKSGERVRAVEPSIDEVFRVLQDAPCPQIPVATE